tara:strand:- start:784 stop:948 length:165 start_codon:yes stop_codon:yes gene_type:complete
MENARRIDWSKEAILNPPETGLPEAAITPDNLKTATLGTGLENGQTLITLTFHN